MVHIATTAVAAFLVSLAVISVIGIVAAMFTDGL